MSDDEPTPAAAAYKRAVEAYAEWLMAHAEEKRAEALFWQTPTERAAEGLACAHFDAKMAQDRATLAEEAWRFGPGNGTVGKKGASVWGGGDPGSGGAVSFAPGAWLSGSSGTVEIGGTVTVMPGAGSNETVMIGGTANHFKREDHQHQCVHGLGKPSE